MVQAVYDTVKYAFFLFIILILFFLICAESINSLFGMKAQSFFWDQGWPPRDEEYFCK